MGIAKFWDTFGDCGEVRSIAEIAAEVIEKKGRPLRIAIDEALWGFHNPTSKAVNAIRNDTQRASNPVEKNILHRLLPLLYLNLDLVFVFDGPQRPPKRGRIPAASQRKEVALFKELLQALGIPYHEAPGEAEAECAAMAKEGVVDIVWSEDSDTLMFGCPVLLRNHMEGKSATSKTKSKTHVQVHKLSTLREQHGIDQDGIRMFALLVGCDYNVGGLRGCGPAIASKIAKLVSQEGLCGETNAHTHDCWRSWIQQCFQNDSDCRKLAVPNDFPNQRTVDYCVRPKVSTRPELWAGYQRRQAERTANINESRLRELLQSRFNCREGEWFKKIEPFLWIKSMRNGDSDQRARSNGYKVGSIKVGEVTAKTTSALKRLRHLYRGAFPEGTAENARPSSKNKVFKASGSRRPDVEDPTPDKTASTEDTGKPTFTQDFSGSKKTPFIMRAAVQTTSQGSEMRENTLSSSPPDIATLFRVPVQDLPRCRPKHNILAAAEVHHTNDARSLAKRSHDDHDNDVTPAKQRSRPSALSKKPEAWPQGKPCIETIELSD